MNATTCPACGDPNACDLSVGRTLIECPNTGCKFYSAKWAALIKPGGEAFYVPPQIGSGRFAAIAGDLNPTASVTASEPESAPAPSPPPVLAPQLRRVVTSKKMRSILFENPGTPRMLWVSREQVPKLYDGGTWYRTDSYEFSQIPEGVWDIVAFSGKLDGCFVRRFEMSTGGLYKDVIARDQPAWMFIEPSACVTPFVMDRRRNDVRPPEMELEIPAGAADVRFRVMFWGRALDRSGNLPTFPRSGRGDVFFR